MCDNYFVGLFWRKMIHLQPVLLFFIVMLLEFSCGIYGYEIQTLSGEPNYKAINLTWDIGTENTNKTDPLIRFPRSFTVFYCELQSFGPRRCRSKILEDNSIDEIDKKTTLKHYSTTIDNLRMATKYSFHIKPHGKYRHQKISARSEMYNNEIDIDSLENGQTIVVPTKGFSAQATKCLPHASEIVVETGPYFAGKIAVDGDKCTIEGNPNDPREEYIMRIDHEKCGSLLKPESNTVETFITVQENLGIFTHSTRRFLVVCTFQSGTQTVRASFKVPGKGGIESVSNYDYQDTDRNARQRNFRIVDKSGLILKDSNKKLNFEQNNNKESDKKETKTNDEIENFNKITNDITNLDIIKNNENINKISYSKLIDNLNEINDKQINNSNSNSGYTTLALAALASISMLILLIYVIQKEITRVKISSSKHEIISNF